MAAPPPQVLPSPPGGGTAVLFVPGVIQTFALVQSDPPALHPRHARGGLSKASPAFLVLFFLSDTEK